VAYRDKRRLSVALDPLAYEWLEACARAEERTITWMASHLLTQALAEREAEKKGSQAVLDGLNKVMGIED